MIAGAVGCGGHESSTKDSTTTATENPAAGAILDVAAAALAQVPEAHRHAQPKAFAIDSVTAFRCFPGAESTEWVVGALDSITCAVLWSERVTDRSLSFGRGPGGLFRFGTAEGIRTVEAATGRVVGTDTRRDDFSRTFRRDGSALAAKGVPYTSNRFLRFENPDGTVRWTIPADDESEQLKLWDETEFGNVILGTMQQKEPYPVSWLIAFDLRTVLAGPRATAKGETPHLTADTGKYGAPAGTTSWGALLAGVFIPVK